MTCEHCGAPLTEGAIFCGECGRAVTPSARRPAPAPVDAERPAPPPLQQPEPAGPRPDPSTDAWLPETTLDPATRAWLAGERDEPGDDPRATSEDPVASDGFLPRAAPSHAHRAESGLGEAPFVQEPDAKPDGQRSVAAPMAVPTPEPVPTPHDRPAWWIGTERSDADGTEHGAVQNGAGEQAIDRQQQDASRNETAGDSDADGSDERPAANDTAAFVVPRQAAPPVLPAALVEPGSQSARCPSCGSELEPDDIFCNACGAVRPSVTAAYTGPIVPLPTERPDWSASLTSASDVDPQADERVSDDVEASPEAVSTPVEDEANAESESRPHDVSDGPKDADDAAAEGLSGPEEDIEATRIVERDKNTAQFVLHFSTGERAVIAGSALLGRFPRSGPGERFDALVTIVDPGKSVSKTHLELGCNSEGLWLSDRFSGNGTTVRHVDGSVRECEPGRRYRVERGARVDIGEQFFLVQ